MKRWLQSGGWLLALIISAGIMLQCAAQDPRPNRAPSRQENKPPKQQRQQQNQQRRQEQRPERRQQQPGARGAQPERKNAEAARNPGTANPPRGPGNLRDSGNRPPMDGQSAPRPNFN